MLAPRSVLCLLKYVFKPEGNSRHVESREGESGAFILIVQVRKREVPEALMLAGYERDSRNSSGEQLALLGLCNVRSVGPGEPGYV